MDQRFPLDDILERNIEQLTKFTTFLDAFTTRTITSSRFVRPVTKYICAKFENEANIVDNLGNEHEPLLASPLTSKSVWDSPINLKLRKLTSDNTKRRTSRMQTNVRVFVNKKSNHHLPAPRLTYIHRRHHPKQTPLFPRHKSTK